MMDSPGFFIPYPFGFPTLWSYLVSDSLAKEAFARYVLRKFYVYDHVLILPDAEVNLEDFLWRLLQNRNTAIVPADPAHDPSILGPLTQKKEDRGERNKQATVIEDTSDLLRVDHYAANSISFSTDFSEPKFLVYTDSFLSNWQAFLNNQRVPLFRANMAFKGLYLPAGANKVLLRYHPPGGQGIYFLGILAFILSFLHLLLSSRQGKGKTG